MTTYKATDLKKVQFIRGIDSTLYCQSCRRDQLFDGRSWGYRRASGKIPRSRQLIQQTTVGGVFHIVDKDTGIRTCKAGFERKRR